MTVFLFMLIRFKLWYHGYALRKDVIKVFPVVIYHFKMKTRGFCQWLIGSFAFLHPRINLNLHRCRDCCSVWCFTFKKSFPFLHFWTSRGIVFSFFSWALKLAPNCSLNRWDLLISLISSWVNLFKFTYSLFESKRINLFFRKFFYMNNKRRKITAFSIRTTA